MYGNLPALTSVPLHTFATRSSSTQCISENPTARLSVGRCFVPGTCYIYYRGGWCIRLHRATRVKVHPVFYIVFYYPVFYYRGEVSPGARLLDLSAEDAFVLRSLQHLLLRQRCVPFPGLTWSSIDRFESGRCLSTPGACNFYYGDGWCIPSRYCNKGEVLPEVI